MKSVAAVAAVALLSVVLSGCAEEPGFETLTAEQVEALEAARFGGNSTTSTSSKASNSTTSKAPTSNSTTTSKAPGNSTGNSTSNTTSSSSTTTTSSSTNTSSSSSTTTAPSNPNANLPAPIVFSGSSANYSPVLGCGGQVPGTATYHDFDGKLAGVWKFKATAGMKTEWWTGDSATGDAGSEGVIPATRDNVAVCPADDLTWPPESYTLTLYHPDYVL